MGKWVLVLAEENGDVPSAALEAGARALYSTHTLDDERAFARDCFREMVAAAPNPADDGELVEMVANVVCRTRHGRPLADATDMGRRQCERMARAVINALYGRGE